MKISEVTVKNLSDYLRIDEPSDIENNELSAMQKAATEYILKYTGLTADEADGFEDLTMALYVVVAEMFDNRNLQTKNAVNENKFVQQLLGLHARNYLPEVTDGDSDD